jgi:hypothetical protein
MLEEAAAYMPHAKLVNPGCKFYGVTAEMNPARLAKVLHQTEPAQPEAAITGLVHLHRPLAQIGTEDSSLSIMIDLADWVRSSFHW